MKGNLRAIIEAEAEAEAEAEVETLLTKIGWLRLKTIRSLIGFDIDVDPEVYIDPLFAKILTKARDRTREWGGEFYFVYLPEFSRYANVVNHDLHAKRGKIIDLVKGLNIPVIDIHQEVFEKHPDPLSLFPQRYYGHYNAEGYGKVAEAIVVKTKN